MSIYKYSYPEEGNYGYPTLDYVFDKTDRFIRNANATMHKFKNTWARAMDFRQRHGLKILSRRKSPSTALVAVKPSNNKMYQKRRRTIQAAGQYTGPFKFPKKKPRIQKNKMALYGSRGSQEGNITINTGNDVAYVGFTSLIRSHRQGTNEVPSNGDKVAASATVQLCMAILRKLLKKYYNVDIESPTQTLEDVFLSSTLTGSGGMADCRFLDIYYKEYKFSSTTAGSTTRPVVGLGHTLDFSGGGTPVLNKSSRLIFIAQAMADKIFGTYEYGALGDNNTTYTRELYGFSFRDAIDSSTTNTNRRGIYRVDTQYIQIDSYVNVYIQNQTTADGGSDSIDVINTNPLNGRIYYFKHPNPVVREYRQVTEDAFNNWKLMHDANGDGVIAPDGTMKFWDGWNQLPYPDQFQNLARYDNISLAPGEMKSFKLKFHFNGLINKFIRNLKMKNVFTESGTTPDENPNEFQYDITMNSNALGTSVLFAFEKRLSSGDGKPIVICQRNVYCDAMLTKRKNITMLPIRGAEQALSVDNTGGA